MGRYVIRRTIAMIGLLFVISFITFGIFFATGSDPGLRACGKACNPEKLAEIHQKLGLDKPVFLAADSQYVTFIKGLFAGRDFEGGTSVNHCPPPCFGYSFKDDTAVWPTLTDRLKVTASLAVGAGTIWVVAGVSVGIVSALRKGTIFDRSAMAVALGAVSIPAYLSALVALIIFSSKLRVLPFPSFVPITENPYEWAKNLILPWITLAFVFAALYARLTRANMLETMGEDYIRTARAKGLSEGRVVGKHGLRAALTPIVTIFGLDLGTLLGGAILTESVYGLPGIGKLAVDAVVNSDLPVIMGVTLFAAFFIIFANLIVDLLYAVLDPKVRFS